MAVKFGSTHPYCGYVDVDNQYQVSQSLSTVHCTNICTVDSSKRSKGTEYHYSRTLSSRVSLLLVRAVLGGQLRTKRERGELDARDKVLTTSPTATVLTLAPQTQKYNSWSSCGNVS